MMGFNNLIRMTMLLMFIFSFFLGILAVAGEEPVNPLVNLSSREDLVQMAGYGEEKLSNVLVTGTVLCESPCFGEKAPPHQHPVQGASVAVSCHTSGKMRKSNWARSTTDEYGDFLIDLPSHLHAIPNLEKLCLVRVLELPKSSLCHRAFTGKHTAMELSSVGNGIRTYTAQRIHLTPKPSHARPRPAAKRARMLYAN